MTHAPADVATARREGICAGCGQAIPEPYTLDSERKRQLAEKARERFWAAVNVFTAVPSELAGDEVAPGEALHLDRVLAVENDLDALRDSVRELDAAIAWQRQLRRELVDLLGAS